MWENLVFSGCGYRAFTYLGVLRVLEEQKKMSHFQRFAGSASGSLIAACVSLGFNSHELEDVLGSHPFNPRVPGLLECILRLATRKGIIDSSLLKAFVATVIAAKVSPDITLLQLHELTQKELVIVATDLTAHQHVYFHHRLHPSVRLVDAIVCSMAIPVLFTPYVVDATFFSNPSLFLNKFPVWLFNDLTQLQTGVFSRNANSTATTLGVTTTGVKKNLSTTPDQKWSLKTYTQMVLSTMSKINNSLEIVPLADTIEITCNLHPLSCPTPEQILQMISEGVTATLQHLEQSTKFS